MIKSPHRYRTLHPAACFCVEFLLINTAVILTASTQFPTSSILWPHAFPYILWAFLTALTCQVCMYYADLYDLKIVISAYSLFTKLLLSITVAIVVLTVIFYLIPQLFISYKVLPISVTIIFSFLVVWRLLYQRLQKINTFKVRF